MIRWKASVGWPRMRNSNHETRFCDRVGGGLHRRIYSQLCPWRLWAWRRISWRLRAQSNDTPRIASTTDSRFSKPDSGPPRSTCAAARHQRAVSAERIRRGYVSRPAAFGVARDQRANDREYRCFPAAARSGFVCQGGNQANAARIHLTWKRVSHANAMRRIPR
jgi:hypothetical protein